MEDELIHSKTWWQQYRKWLFLLAGVGAIGLTFLVLMVRDFHDGPDKKIPFDKTRWNAASAVKDTYRHQMLDALMASDTLKKCDRNEVLDLLGPPNRTDGEYLFYTIQEDRLGLVLLHVKTMVVKFENDSVEWVKIHG
jgi:hypothetical protein